MVISASAVDTGRTYLFYAKGNANVSVLGEYFAYITNKTYDTATNTLSAVIHIPQGANRIILSFENTTGPGLQNISG